MATERFEMSSAPWGEAGAQVGEEGYELRARQECRRYQAQLRRHYSAHHGGNSLPEGCRLIVKGHSHDFGTYYEVAAVCDDSDDVALRAADWLQSNQPENWDKGE